MPQCPIYSTINKSTLSLLDFIHQLYWYNTSYSTSYESFPLAKQFIYLKIYFTYIPTHSQRIYKPSNNSSISCYNNSEIYVSRCHRDSSFVYTSYFQIPVQHREKQSQEKKKRICHSCCFLDEILPYHSKNPKPTHTRIHLLPIILCLNSLLTVSRGIDAPPIHLKMYLLSGGFTSTCCDVHIAS